MNLQWVGQNKKQQCITLKQWRKVRKRGATLSIWKTGKCKNQKRACSNAKEKETTLLVKNSKWKTTIDPQAKCVEEDAKTKSNNQQLMATQSNLHIPSHDLPAKNFVSKKFKMKNKSNQPLLSSLPEVREFKKKSLWGGLVAAASSSLLPRKELHVHNFSTFSWNEWLIFPQKPDNMQLPTSSDLHIPSHMQRKKNNFVSKKFKMKKTINLWAKCIEDAKTKRNNQQLTNVVNPPGVQCREKKKQLC